MATEYVKVANSLGLGHTGEVREERGTLEIDVCITVRYF